MPKRRLPTATPWFVLAGVLLLAALVASQVEVRRPPRPRGSVDDLARLAARDDVSLLFVLIDTLRADHLHGYGYPRETSPAIDALAATGVRFAHVVAQSSWTKTSMASLWTSTWPRRHGVLRHHHALPDEAELPAERLRDAGFRTAGLWRNGWVAPNFGFHQGFATYLKPVPGATPERFERSTPSSQWIGGSDEDATQAARAFLRAYGRERFFLYVHYMDVHQYAFDELSARFGTGYADSYDNAIHWVDRNVAALLRELADLDLWRKTIVVIASDHGEGFREHGLEGHARTLYREVVEVPWILALPFVLEPGVVVRETVGNVDVWPTLYELLGLAPPPGLDGRSLVASIVAAARGAEPAGDPRPYYAELDRAWGRPGQPASPLVRVVTGRWRHIEPLVEPGAPPTLGLRRELFDAERDPDEQADLVAAGHPLPPESEEALARYLAERTPPWDATPREVALDELELDQLRALGYVIR